LVLADSIAETLRRSRVRLARLIEISLEVSLNEGGADYDRPIASRLGYHLTALAPAITWASSAGQAAALLADVTIAEAIRGQTERLAAVVLGGRGHGVPPPTAAAAAELRACCGARFTSRALRVGSAGAFAGLAARVVRLAADAPELAGIAAQLGRMSELLDNDRIELPSEETEIDEPAVPPPTVVRNFLIRFSARHTLALTAAFMIGVWDNNPALHAAIWLLMLGGPPSHGATVRKFTMRDRCFGSARAGGARHGCRRSQLHLARSLLGRDLLGHAADGVYRRGWWNPFVSRDWRHSLRYRLRRPRTSR
jgi:hypothetical protein